MGPRVGIIIVIIIVLYLCVRSLSELFCNSSHVLYFFLLHDRVGIVSSMRPPET